MQIFKIFIYIIIIFIVYLILSQLETNTKINFHEKLNPEYYDDSTFHFDYSWFPPDKVNEIKSFVNRGKKLARKKKIIIAGLARNIEKMVDKTIKRLESIGIQFSEYKIIIFENDSDDNTRNILKTWSNNNPNVILLDCNHLGSPDCKLKQRKGYDIGVFSQERINKMAFYRTQYMDYIQKHYLHYDYLLVTDFDLDGNQCIDGLFHSLGHKSWDAIFANGKFSIPGTFGTIVNTYDAMAYVDNSESFSEGKSSANDTPKMVTKFINMMKLSSDYDLIPVKSAFNGYGIYKMKSIAGHGYQGSEKCEHINLAKHMIKNKKSRIYINPIWYGYFNLQGPGSLLDTIISSVKK